MSPAVAEHLAEAVATAEVPDPILAGSPPGGRFLVVSDRLPIALSREGGRRWVALPTRSALGSALAPVLRARRGVWLGWPGVSEEEVPRLGEVLAGAIDDGGFTLRPVTLSEEESRGCFGGFSGEMIWPLFHDLQEECNFDPASWMAFRSVNRKFARAVARTVGRTDGPARDVVWVHDHLLMNFAIELRRLRVPARMAFFLHLPFPAPDMFRKMPWRSQVLAGLLAFDRLGFQTRRDLENFLACVRDLVPEAELDPVRRGLWNISGRRGRRCFELSAGVFPIGIDYRDFEERAARPEVAARAAALRAAHPDRKLLLGVDRLDRSKGIPEKIRAFSQALERYPDLREKASLLQVVVPNRDNLPRHAALRSEIEGLVGEVNGRFSRPGWVPIHYLHRALDPEVLLACYRAADVALVTPTREGMNLVAKEYCAADVEERGALVLSEFAGAAAQLGEDALLVNPHDTRGMARTLRQALRLGEDERKSRMRRMRQEVWRHDVYFWADSFLSGLLPGRSALPIRAEAGRAR